MNMIAPSSNSTIECTIDCGCSSTVIFSTGVPNSQCASITSKPLFTSVDESIVIFAPISHWGWRSACSTVTSASFSQGRSRNAPPLRPFRVPGGHGMLRVLAYVPMALILISIFFTAVPLSFDTDTLSYYLPITIGSILSIVIGEILIAARARRHS